MILGTVDEKARQELGFPILCAELSRRAKTPMGRELCEGLLPLDERAEIERRLARAEEARTLTRFEKLLPVEGALDLRGALGRAAREGTLEPAELLSAARLIRVVASVRRFCASQADRAPLHFELAEQLTDQEPLAHEIERAFDASGRLADSASPLLSELRERARGLHRAIKQRLEQLLLEPELAAMLRDTYYSVRGDRYVLPVRAEHKNHLPGIVHNASGSGQTLFIEPQELVELGNQLTIAESSALEEEQRILGELSQALGRRAPALAADVEILAALDLSWASAALADDLRAHPAAIADATDGSFALLGLRHPLLVLQMLSRGRAGQVVPNRVELQSPARGLIVSGPNAGGKTVTITAIGLCALMARCGLAIPADEGSRLPLYRTVYTAIGDEGDLSRDLSTFTAHLTALKRILESAGPGALVLIDEIAADTDPREGAAIAVAALEKLVGLGAQVLITTHLEELKALGLSDPRFASASVGFDVDRLAPTYRLALGAVGASSAIEIARRVGLPQDVCERARTVLGGGSSAIAQAVEQLEVARNEARRAREEAQAAQVALTRERELLEKERKALRQLERLTQAGARQKLVEEIEQKREEAAKILAGLQAAPGIAAAVAAQRQLEQAAEEARARAAVEAARAQVRGEDVQAGRSEPVGPLRPGSPVRHARLGTERVILELSGEQAVVQLGALKTKVGLDELVPLARKPKVAPAQFKKTRAEKLSRADAAKAAPVVAQKPLIDVRGERVDEALRKLELHLDQFLRDGLEEVHVLHGLGSGALKAAVREALSRSPYVKRARAAAAHEGGDGVTVAELSE